MGRKKWLISLVILALQAAPGYAQTVSSNLLRCRLCNRASTLSDCNKLVTCDGTLEDCYMDEIITDQLNAVYSAGCRAKDVCALGSSGSIGRKRDLVACSRCCNFKEDCNKRLCGIKDDTVHSLQCYSCDHRTSDQSQISDPMKCVTLDTCQTNEVCYATQSDIAGEDTFFYGCLSEFQCTFLMEKAYENYQVCVKNTTMPPNGLTWTQACGVLGPTSLCHSCCADGGCNYGTCKSLNERIFKLVDQAKLCFERMGRTKWPISLVILALQATLGYAQTVSSNLLQCRLCDRASTLSDCNKLVTCDGTLENCYMDEIITDQLTVVYNAGCRAKDVCALGSSRSASIGRKRDSVACSRCCNFERDCNKRLCAIKDDTLNASQCYSCDHRTSDQSEVKDPMKCVTLDTCQQNEVCYATQSDIGGKDAFFYGCLSKFRCTVLMGFGYENYQVCVKNTTSPPNGLTWIEACGNLGKLRSTNLCHSCCADGGCNYGTCKSINERIFKLVDQGKFDLKTLKVI